MTKDALDGEIEEMVKARERRGSRRTINDDPVMMKSGVDGE